VRLFKALEERARSLQQAAENAQVSEHIKDEILHNVSHEIRLPLQSAMGHLDLLMEGHKGHLSAEQNDTLRASQEKLKQLGDMVESMITLQQVETPRQSGAVDMNDLARQVITRYQRLAQQNGVTIYPELSVRPVFAYANSGQISKVLEGLLSNAIKFSPQGSEVTVHVERAKDGQAHVAVQDKGIGIEAQHIPRIFERFYQVDGSTPRHFGGLGIGLALVKEIVNTHGGKVWVESKPKEGSVFHFSLPAPT
jgi:signal transduction histidine kinase